MPFLLTVHWRGRRGGANVIEYFHDNNWHDCMDCLRLLGSSTCLLYKSRVKYYDTMPGKYRSSP